MKKIEISLIVLFLVLTLCSCQLSGNVSGELDDFGDSTTNETESNESLNNDNVSETPNVPTGAELYTNAIKNSIYAKNISANYYAANEDGSRAEGTIYYSVYVDNANIKIDVDFINGVQNYFIKNNGTGLEVYENGEYLNVDDVNPHLYCMAPFPTFDNISYTNFGIYQDSVGTMTDIVIANIDKVYFDEASGFYKITEMCIKHGELDSYFITVPGGMIFSYYFKLSSDQTYVKTIMFEILSSSHGFNDFRLKMDFFDYGNTNVVMP